MDYALGFISPCDGKIKFRRIKASEYFEYTVF